MNNLNIRATSEDTIIQSCQGAERQQARQENLQSLFEQAVEFVRATLVNALPVMDMQHAETVLALHDCKGYRQALEHVLIIH